MVPEDVHAFFMAEKKKVSLSAYVCNLLTLYKEAVQEPCTDSEKEAN